MKETSYDIECSVNAHFKQTNVVYFIGVNLLTFGQHENRMHKQYSTFILFKNGKTECFAFAMAFENLNDNRKK